MLHFEITDLVSGGVYNEGTGFEPPAEFSVNFSHKNFFLAGIAIKFRLGEPKGDQLCVPAG